MGWVCYVVYFRLFVLFGFTWIGCAVELLLEILVVLRLVVSWFLSCLCICCLGCFSVYLDRMGFGLVVRFWVLGCCICTSCGIGVGMLTCRFLCGV